ncbi:MAG: leishmanolysin-related zinc metalloendopeptidase, partial [Planctomycetota bacterium]
QFRFQGVSAADQAVFQQAAARWESIIVGDLPNATYGGVPVDDLLIDVSILPIDGAGSVLGQAGPDAFRRGSGLPYHGSMEFDSADIAALRANGGLAGVIAHEMGHVLGIGTLWASKRLVAGLGGSNPQFVGPQTVAAFNQVFRTNVSSVPLEATGGPGTRDSHWREAILRNELMTGWVGPGVQMPLSVITVASLADIGYSVNYAAADVYTPALTGSAALAAINASSSVGGTAGGSASVRSAGGTATGSLKTTANSLPTVDTARSGTLAYNTSAVSGMVLKTFATAGSSTQKPTGRVTTNAIDTIFQQWSANRSPWDQTGWRI